MDETLKFLRAARDLLMPAISVAERRLFPQLDMICDAPRGELLLVVSHPALPGGQQIHVLVRRGETLDDIEQNFGGRLDAAVEEVGTWMAEAWIGQREARRAILKPNPPQE